MNKCCSLKNLSFFEPGHKTKFLPSLREMTRHTVTPIFGNIHQCSIVSEKDYRVLTLIIIFSSLFLLLYGQNWIGLLSESNYILCVDLREEKFTIFFFLYLKKKLITKWIFASNKWQKFFVKFIIHHPLCPSKLALNRSFKLQIWCFGIWVVYQKKSFK